MYLGQLDSSLVVDYSQTNIAIKSFIMTDIDLADILVRAGIDSLERELLDAFDKPVDISAVSTELSRKLLYKTIERAKKRLESVDEPAPELLRSPVGSLSF